MDKFTFEALSGEKWKPIKGFDGYFISSFGRVWSNKQKCRFLGTYPDGCGHYHVRLCINGKQFSKLVHRLVAETFVKNPNEYKGDCVYLNKCRNSVIAKLPKTNIEWMREASANDVARLIATKLCELAKHEYGIYDVVDYATVFEWLKEKHNEM